MPETTPNPFAVLIPPGNEPPEPEPRPVTAVLVLPGGERVPLDHTVVIGRNPQDAGSHLVTLDTASAKVSRTHARLRLDGDQVVLDDLGSRNGTGLTVPGTARRRVAPNESAHVPIGSVIDFEVGLEVTVAPE